MSVMSASARKWITLFAIIGVVLLVDQVSKRWVVDNLALGETVVPVEALSPFFQITRGENTGAAFGIFPQTGDLFLVIAVVVVIGMLIFYPRVDPHAVLMQVGMGLISGGALGNALDRLEYGAVVDFVHLRIPNLISNVSNFADHAIVLGAVLIVLASWRADRAAEAAAQSAFPEEE